MKRILTKKELNSKLKAYIISGEVEEFVENTAETEEKNYEKSNEFRCLAEDVSKCHICERIATLPHVENSECLENDDHGWKRN